MCPSQSRKSWSHCVFIRFLPSIREQRSSRRKQRWRKLGNMCRVAPNPKSLTVILLQEICQMWNEVTDKKNSRLWQRPDEDTAEFKLQVCLRLEGQQMLNMMTQSADHWEECCHRFHNSEQVPKTTEAWDWPYGLASPVHLPDTGFLPSEQMRHLRSFKVTRTNHVQWGTLRIKGDLIRMRWDFPAHEQNKNEDRLPLPLTVCYFIRNTKNQWLSCFMPLMSATYCVNTSWNVVIRHQTVTFKLLNRWLSVSVICNNQ